MKLPRTKRIPRHHNWHCLIHCNPLSKVYGTTRGDPPVITWPIGIGISGSQQCNAYVFGTESFSETLAKFRSQTHPFTFVHTLLSGQPQQETQGLYLTDGKSFSE